VKNKIKYKLIIMGEGPERSAIENLILKFNLSNYIYLVGYFANPYILLKHSKAVISSSNWEGLPLALIESLALGKHVISTDCPYGPREILDDGRYGILVPPNNVKLLSEAIKDISSNLLKIDRKLLVDRSKYFSLDRALSQFDTIFKL
jgi:glycosyltransferase involved in cell wall biosynthesis